jgi:predicted protein tyrosine phosphatase
MNVLFVCSRNRRRSLTAEALFSGRAGLSVLSAGTRADAETVISADLVEWADLILAMEKHHRDDLTRRFGKLLQDRKIAILGIRDQFDYMDSELVRLLQQKVEKFITRT